MQITTKIMINDAELVWEYAHKVAKDNKGMVNVKVYEGGSKYFSVLSKQNNKPVIWMNCRFWL